MSVTIILPTFNERENITGILERIRNVVPDATVLVVDDGSPDGTADAARSVATALGGIEVLERSSKDGLGSAYRFAFDRVLSSPSVGESDVVVTMDADFSHDPDIIPRMVQVVADGADAVIGSRYVDGGGTANWPIHRRLLSRWGNRYTAWILGVPVRDCTSGFRAYRVGALRSIRPDSTTAEGYAFLTELVTRLNENGQKIEETPILFIDRAVGASKMSRQIIVESMTLVTKWGVLRRLSRRKRRP